jgi:hypothetical protein
LSIPITIVLIGCSFLRRRQGPPGRVALPLEPFAGNLGLSVDYRPPLVERALQVVPESPGDQLVGELLNLVALEHEHDLARGQVDAVPLEALFGEVEGQALGDELGGPLHSSFFQVRDDC